MKYNQCKMIRRSVAGVEEQTAFIPSKYAVKGKYIKLKEEDGWQVVSVGVMRTSQEINRKNKADKHQRISSDI